MFTHVRKKDLFRLSLDSKSLQKKVMSPLFQRLAAQLKKQKCVIARPDPVFLLVTEKVWPQSLQRQVLRVR